MQYLGGKFRIGKKIAAIINEKRLPGQVVWEPFCGGLNATVAIGGPIRACDIREDLIALYRAVQGGWIPPDTVTEADYAAARNYPLSDPMHAFCAYGCSFGGKRWGGYARNATSDNYAIRAKRALLRDIPKIVREGGLFEVIDFFSITPNATAEIIYADPPYRSATGYGAKFDFAAFDARCIEWANYTTVFVSEYSFPHGRIVLDLSTKLGLQSLKRERQDRLYMLP